MSNILTSETEHMAVKIGICSEELQSIAIKIKSLRQRSVEYAIEIGHELLRVKARLPHGIFIKWIENQCEFKIRMAQDLMKLARDAELNTDVVGMMVPSTLRIYLSRKTPPHVKHLVRTRLLSGERVSRNDLRLAISQAKANVGHIDADLRSPRLTGSGSVDPLGILETGSLGNSERSKEIANLLIRRLSKQDYEYVMDNLSWDVWNRVLLWLRAASSESTNTARCEPNQIGAYIAPGRSSRELSGEVVE